MSSQPLVVKEFKLPNQFLEHRNEKTTTVFSTLGCRISIGAVSDEDKTLRHKHISTSCTTEKKSTSHKSFSVNTMNIKCCESKQLKKESEAPVSWNEALAFEGRKKADRTLPQIIKITGNQFSRNNIENITEDSKNPNNHKRITHHDNERNAPNTAAHAAMKQSLNSKYNDLRNHQLITVQIPKTCSSNSQQLIPQSLQTFSDKGKFSKQPKVSSSSIVQAVSTSEKDQNYSKPMVISSVRLISTQTTSSREAKYQVGSSWFTTTPMTTAPDRSGLRLLSIVSAGSSPNKQQMPTSPTVKMVPGSSKTTVKIPTTQDGLLTSPTTTLKALTIAYSPNSKVKATQTIKAIAGSPKTTPKIPTTTQLANLPSSSTTISPTPTYHPITPPRSTPTTPRKPSPHSLTHSLVTPTKDTPSTRDSPTASPLSLPDKQTMTPPPLKENESPRTPQSEPIFKAWIPPLDTDPMSQTFLRMPFTYQSLQVQCNHGSRPHVKRPMNAFMVWAKKNRASIAKRFPNASNAEISVRLGHIWNELPSDEQKPYFDEANALKEKHKHENPNWVYQPRPGKKCRKALFQSSASKSQPTSPLARRVTTKDYERPIHPRSAPSSPAVKRPLWPHKKTEMSEEELQSRIVEDLLEEEIEEKVRVDEGTGNPTMDKYIDEWLSPKRTRRDGANLCLMSDAMLPAVNDEQNILEEETRCDGRDFEKYIKQLKFEQNNLTKLENNISNLDEDDEMTMEGEGAEVLIKHN